MALPATPSATPAGAASAGRVEPTTAACVPNPDPLRQRYKRCSRCLHFKTRAEFSFNQRSPDLMSGWCRQCNRQYQLELDPERRAAYKRQSRATRRTRYHTDPAYRARRINEVTVAIARRRGAEGEYSYSEWCYLLALCCNSCVACGLIFLDPEKLTRDHIVPVTRGGSNLIENLQPLCLPCNSAKGNRTAINYLAQRGIVLDLAHLARLRAATRLSPLERFIRPEFEPDLEPEPAEPLDSWQAFG